MFAATVLAWWIPLSSFRSNSQGRIQPGVDRNPGTLQLHAALHVGELMDAGWVLGSWCGSRDGVVATATFAGLSASQPLTHQELPYGHHPCATLSMFELFRQGPGPG